jgi:hypothetical protein
VTRAPIPKKQGAIATPYVVHQILHRRLLPPQPILGLVLKQADIQTPEAIPLATSKDHSMSPQQQSSNGSFARMSRKTPGYSSRTYHSDCIHLIELLVFLLLTDLADM